MAPIARRELTPNGLPDNFNDAVLAEAAPV
jgi:hypothetical protein